MGCMVETRREEGTTIWEDEDDDDEIQSVGDPAQQALQTNAEEVRMPQGGGNEAVEVEDVADDEEEVQDVVVSDPIEVD